MTVDDYIAALPDASQERARAIRAAVHAAAPDATEAIKYGMPAFQVGGVSFLYLGVWKKHVALYPIYRGDAAYEAQVGPYRAEKDSVRFALGKPVPLEIVSLIAKAQLERTLEV